MTDAFIAIFNSAGVLQKATYLGTSRMDAIYGLKFDRKGFPYVTGVTLGDWPVTPGVYNNPRSKQFIVKLKPDLSATEYSTVFGSGNTNYNISPVAFSVDICENVYVSGWGGAGPPNSPDAFHTAGTRGMPTRDCDALPKAGRSQFLARAQPFDDHRLVEAVSAGQHPRGHRQQRPPRSDRNGGGNRGRGQQVGKVRHLPTLSTPVYAFSRGWVRPSRSCRRRADRPCCVRPSRCS